MAKKNRKSGKKNDRNPGMVAAVIAGGLGLILGLFVLGRRDRDGESGRAGAADRALGLPSTAAGDGGSSAADLGLDQPHHGPGDRAADEFRPDATAAIPVDRRDAFSPATLPNPNAAQPAM